MTTKNKRYEKEKESNTMAAYPLAILIIMATAAIALNSSSSTTSTRAIELDDFAAERIAIDCKVHDYLANASEAILIDSPYDDVVVLDNIDDSSFFLPAPSCEAPPRPWHIVANPDHTFVTVQFLEYCAAYIGKKPSEVQEDDFSSKEEYLRYTEKLSSLLG